MNVIVRYHEIALKGRNRPWFVHVLVRNIRTALGGLGVTSVRSMMGRIEIAVADDAALPEVRQRLTRMFGIANYASVRRAPSPTSRPTESEEEAARFAKMPTVPSRRSR